LLQKTVHIHHFDNSTTKKTNFIFVLCNLSSIFLKVMGRSKCFY